MMRKNRLILCLVSSGAIISTLCLLSCASTPRGDLEEVARDWAYTIRAGQIIPVFPLTEDLKPGDVFLVTAPINDQVKIYEKKGYLPLDQHLYRLSLPESGAVQGDAENTKGIYRDFYGERFMVSGGSKLPDLWEAPSASRGIDGKDAQGASEAAGAKDSWASAPHAAFPSYNFTVKSGTGLNAAIPIQGIPVSMGIMGSKSAYGSVTFSDVYTYGLDTFRMWQVVQSWANTSRVRQLLSAYGPRGPGAEPGKFQYLRVITRVYLVRSLVVSISNDRAGGAALGAGANPNFGEGARPAGEVSDSSPEREGRAAESGKSAVQGAYAAAEETAVASAKANQFPGASFKIVKATNRGVTLSERFSKPLVVGYVGFDLPIFQGGRLGRPIATLDQLAGSAPAVGAFSPTELDLTRLRAFEALRLKLEEASSSDMNAKRLVDGLDELARSIIPYKYAFNAYSDSEEKTVNGKAVLVPKLWIKKDDVIERRKFETLIDYLEMAANTVETLGRYKDTVKDKQMTEDYGKAKDVLRDAAFAFEKSSVFIAAIDYGILGIMN
jgi:hypothetical protein